MLQMFVNQKFRQGCVNVDFELESGAKVVVWDREVRLMD